MLSGRRIASSARDMIATLHYVSEERRAVSST